MPPSKTRTFGAELAALKKRRRLSYGDLQIRTGLSAGQLCHIVKGKRRPSDGAIADIAKALDVPPDHFQEYRHRAVCGLLERQPDYVDRLYHDLAVAPRG